MGKARLIESKAVLNPQGDVILRQLIQVGRTKPEWLDQNISALSRKPEEKGEPNSEDAFLLGLALAEKTTATELRRRLADGETIYIYKPKGAPNKGR